MEVVLGQVALWLGALVAGALAVAATLKLRDIAQFRRQLLDYGVFPRVLVPFLSWAVPVAEALTAAAYVLPASRRFAGMVMAVLMVGFSIVIVLALARGRRQISCACFGARSASLGTGTVARNLALAACAVAPVLFPDARASAAGFAVVVLACAGVAVLASAARVGILRPSS